MTSPLVRSQIDSLYPDSKNDNDPASRRRESCPTSPASRRLWSIFSSLEKSSGCDTGSPVRGRRRVRFPCHGTFAALVPSIESMHSTLTSYSRLHAHSHTHTYVPFTVCNEYIYIYIYVYVYVFICIYIMHVGTYEENVIHPYHAHQKILTSRRAASHEQSVPAPPL